MQAKKRSATRGRVAVPTLGMAIMLGLGACTIPFGGPERSPVRQPTAPQPTGTLVQGGKWVREDATDAQRQAAIDDCYNYAVGSVQRSQQVEDDSQAARETSADLRGYADFQSRLQAHAGQRRVHTLFTECMEDKGYRRADDSE
jgi:hypothetical protein